MLVTIILLAGEAELPVLSSILLQANSELNILGFSSLADLPRELGLLATARLVAFLFPDIVPASILGRLGFGAYNFHPGPPEYPGWAPVSFALYDGVGHFGATVHEMVPKIDAGVISDVENFAVPENATLETLSALTYCASLKLFERWAEVLASPLRLPRLPLQWGSRCGTKRQFAEMAGIPSDASEEEVRRRLLAFGQGDGYTPPTATPGP